MKMMLGGAEAFVSAAMTEACPVSNKAAMVNRSFTVLAKLRRPRISLFIFSRVKAISETESTRRGLLPTCCGKLPWMPPLLRRARELLLQGCEHGRREDRLRRR